MDGCVVAASRQARRSMRNSGSAVRLPVSPSSLAATAGGSGAPSPVVSVGGASSGLGEGASGALPTLPQPGASQLTRSVTTNVQASPVR